MKAGGAAEARTVDATGRAQVAEAVAATMAARGRLGVPAAIAGVMHSSTVVDTDDADLDRVLPVNFKAGPALRPRGRAPDGRAWRRQYRHHGLRRHRHRRPRAALLQRLQGRRGPADPDRTLATELGPRGVRANAVAPGFVRTPMTGHHGIGPDGRFDERAQALAEEARVRAAPLGRVGDPRDVAHTVLFLASDASAFTTGQILRPDGGVVMPW